MRPQSFLSLLLLNLSPLFALSGEPAKVIPLWPGTPPGDQAELGPEHDTTKPSDHLVAGKSVIRLGNVSQPTISIYRPAAGQDRHAAVLVCPGGGYNILAMDLEGTEVCDWLNAQGITGVLLKYRVPKRPGREVYAAPLQDAQRALGLVRFQAKTWGWETNRIGVLGFSAGGHLAAALSNNYEARTYPAVDKADAVSCRPDFAVLIYPAYLTVKNENGRTPPELNLTSNTPPTFMVMAQDDPVGVENVLYYSLALRRAKTSFELHVYPAGGHGYGLRPTEDSVTTWPARASEWLAKLF